MITCRPRLLEIFSSCARTSPTMTRDTSRGSASGSSNWVLLHSEWSVACLVRGRAGVRVGVG
eukprot:scaffold135307_cov69-Phaeocystis_antarctica.AAC.5